jgi:hypothetical protein
MIKEDKVAIASIVLGVYSISLISAFIACQANIFPFNMVIPLLTGIVGTILVMYCGWDI